MKLINIMGENEPMNFWREKPDLPGEVFTEDYRYTPEENISWREPEKKRVRLSTFSTDGYIVVGDGETWFFLVPEDAVDLANQLMALAQNVGSEE